jgi:hypothetical protein
VVVRKDDLDMRLILLTAGILLLAAKCSLSEPLWLGGQGPPFGFVADASGGLQRGDTLSIVAQFGARYYPTSARASIHLVVPPALGLLRGDTLVVGSLGDMRGHWTYLFTPQQPGQYEVRGRVTIDAGSQGVDECEFVMPVAVGAESVVVERSRYVRLELRKEGRRYRYADWWLVPLDSTEVSAVQVDLEARGARARPTGPAAATCSRCASTSTPDSVHFVVIVGPDGNIRDWKLLGSSLRRDRRPDADVAAAAEAALKGMTFQPAEAGGQAVSDFVYVAIPVRQGP